MPEPDKTELFLISQGNEIAFGNFMERYSSRIFYHAYGIVGDKEIAKEIVSDVFLEVWNHRRRLSAVSDMLSWLNVIAYHKAISAYRRENRLKMWSLDELQEFHFPEIQSPLEGIISEEDRRRLNAAIDGLPPKCKHIFFLAKIEQMSYADIAKLLQISTSTVNYHVTYALTALRKKLRKAM